MAKKINAFQKEKDANEKQRKMRSTKKFRTPKDLQAKIDEYFNSLQTRIPVMDAEKNMVLDEHGKQVYDILQVPPTVSGLARYLGFTSRTDIINYEKNESYKEYHNIIKDAKLQIMEYLEMRMHTASKPTGAIFILKNMGAESLSDKQEISVVDEVAKLKLKYQQDADDLLANARRSSGSDSEGSGK